MSMRAIYERRKEWFLNMKGRKQQEEQKQEQSKTDSELKKMIYPHYGTKIRTDVNVATMEEDIKEVLKTEHSIVGLSNRQIHRVRKLLETENK